MYFLYDKGRIYIIKNFEKNSIVSEVLIPPFIINIEPIVLSLNYHKVKNEPFKHTLI